jgi:hypothetical protein
LQVLPFLQDFESVSEEVNSQEERFLVVRLFSQELLLNEVAVFFQARVSAVVLQLHEEKPSMHKVQLIPVHE